MLIKKNFSTKHKRSIKQHGREKPRDALSKIPNRQYFQEALQQQIILAEKLKKTFFMLIINIDHFRSINDLYGYDIGDDLLIALAKRLRATLNLNDVYARWGGDEFAVLLIDAQTKDDVIIMANSLVQTLSTPYTISRKKIQIFVSIGIGQFNANMTFSHLIKNTDLALQSAKDKGRNRSEHFEDKIGIAFNRFHLIESALKNAIINKEITMVFQPIIELSTHTISHLEALARWNSSELQETIHPVEFIHVAEQSNLILSLTDLIVHITCQIMQKWKRELKLLIPVAINFSALDMLQKNFVVKLNNIIQHYGITPYFIHIELTETALINNFNVLHDTILQLRQQGFRIAIDDFGTGYSSLERLKNLSVDYIKIDQSFIMSMFTDTYSIQIVRGILDITKQLGISAIAEGVETIEIAQFLMRWRCHYAQGYFFSHPVLPQNVLSLIVNYNGAIKYQKNKSKSNVVMLCNFLIRYCQDMNNQFATLLGHGLLLLQKLPPESDIYNIVKSIHFAIEDGVRHLWELIDKLTRIQQDMATSAHATKTIIDTLSSEVKQTHAFLFRSIVQLEFSLSPILNKQLELEPQYTYHFEDIFALVIHLKFLNEQFLNVLTDKPDIYMDGPGEKDV